MKKYIFILLIAFAACTKDQQLQQCKPVYLISYKYSLPDTVFIRPDTLWHGTDCDLQGIPKDTAFCNTAGTYEILRYVIK